MENSRAATGGNAQHGANRLAESRRCTDLPTAKRIDHRLAILHHRQPGHAVREKTVDRVANPHWERGRPIDRCAVPIIESISDTTFDGHSGEGGSEAEHDRAGLIIYPQLPSAQKTIGRRLYT